MSAEFMPFNAGDIARAVEEGREAERGRIIALLEAAPEYAVEDSGVYSLGLNQFIALIKGEVGLDDFEAFEWRMQ